MSFYRWHILQRCPEILLQFLKVTYSTVITVIRIINGSPFETGHYSPPFRTLDCSILSRVALSTCGWRFFFILQITFLSLTSLRYFVLLNAFLTCWPSWERWWHVAKTCFNNIHSCDIWRSSFCISKGLLSLIRVCLDTLWHSSY